MNEEDLWELLNAASDQDSDAQVMDLIVLVHKQASITMNELTKEYKEIQSSAKAMATKIIEDTGRKNWNKDLQNGQLYLPEAGMRVSYNTELLDKYLQTAPPEVQAVLLLAREEKLINSGLTIR